MFDHEDDIESLLAEHDEAIANRKDRKDRNGNPPVSESDASLDPSKKAELDELKHCVDLLEAFRVSTPRDAPLLSRELTDLSSDRGRMVAHFSLMEVLGHGAFGVVYRAIDEELGREVALKLPRPEVLFDGEKLRRFQAEATTTASLDHPSIVPVLAADLSGPMPYIASAFCAGPDLGEWLAATPNLPATEDVAQFVARLADAVQFAHNHGVLHRDLKPSNVLLEPIEKILADNSLSAFLPRLTDFGLSKVLEANLDDTRSSLVVGTPLYMAPEQLLPTKQKSGSSTDVYGLGVLLFELLTRQTPFEGASYLQLLDRIRNDDAPGPREISPDVPLALDSICRKCLEKDPNDRYENPAELRDDLQRFCEHKDVIAKPITLFQRFLRWCRPVERMKSAGKLAFKFHSFVVAWMIPVASFMVLGTDELSSEQTREVLLGSAFVVAAFHLPAVLIAWQLGKGKMWPFWPSLLLGISVVAILLLSWFTDAGMFTLLYPTFHSRVGVYAGLSMMAAGVLIAHLVAIPAWCRERENQVVATNHKSTT